MIENRNDTQDKGQYARLRLFPIAELAGTGEERWCSRWIWRIGVEQRGKGEGRQKVTQWRNIALVVLATDPG